ncbi:hypothetical protein KCU77_g11236, partial [Aureobasidium melanogenum]
LSSQPQTPTIKKAVSPSSSAVHLRGPFQAVSVPGRRPLSEHFGTVVTITVGPQKKAFVIHKDVLCFCSDYFRAAFNGSFKEAIEGKLSLPDEDADLFYIVNGFVYTRQLRQEDRQTGPQLSHRTLGQLWAFGDRYLMPALQNTAMDACIKRISLSNNGWFTGESMEREYGQTSEGSPLRRFLVDWQAHKSEQSKERLGQWPQEALVDLATTLSSMKSEHRGINKLPDDRGKCYYHVHAEGEHC